MRAFWKEGEGGKERESKKSDIHAVFPLSKESSGAILCDPLTSLDIFM